MTLLDDLLTGPQSGLGQDLWAEALRQAETPDVNYRTDPKAWVTDVLHETTHAVQDEIWQSVIDNRFTAVPSCAGAGKSYIGSRIGAWIVDTAHKAGLNVILVTTAPSAAQVSSIMWEGIREAMRVSRANGRDIPGRINRGGYPQWFIDDQEYGMGRKPADHELSAFQGIHRRDGVFVIVDEAGGIKKPLWDSIMSIVTSRGSRILALGNPDDASSHFARICKPDSGYNVIHLDALRLPGFSDEGTRDFPLVRALMAAERIPFSTEPLTEDMAGGLTNPQTVTDYLQTECNVTAAAAAEAERRGDLDEFLRRRTRASQTFMVKMRGEFSEASANSMIPLGWINRAVERWRDWDAAGRPENPGRRVVGVDVADMGPDATAIAIRQGWCIEKIETYRKEDTEQVAGHVRPWLDTPRTIAVVDTNGVGAGVGSVLRHDRDDRHLHAAEIVSYNAGGRDKRLDLHGNYQFVNYRSFMWWRMRELLDPSQEGGARVMLPPDDELITELSTPTKSTRSGVPVEYMMVEKKDDVRKKLGRSTDKADAVIQTFFVDGSPESSQGGSNVAWGTGTPDAGLHRYGADDDDEEWTYE